MRLSCITIVLLSTFGLCYATNAEDAFACNCDEQCDEEKVIGLGEETTNIARRHMYQKDSDGDGNRTICARSRDFNDRTFPSVCHMLCYNRCTRYRYIADKENDVKKYKVVAYRRNYYKLKNGACAENDTRSESNN